MIDTDKYEGHTEGPWEWGSYEHTQYEAEPHPDKLLRKDAPLLLAEVKRLTQLNYEQRVEMQRLRDAYSAIATLVENVWGTFND